MDKKYTEYIDWFYDEKLDQVNPANERKPPTVTLLTDSHTSVR